MNTLAALEQYSDLCDELDLYMHEENSHLRADGNDQEILVNRKRQILSKLENGLKSLRMAGPVKSADHSASSEVRKRVLGKILKLLLLSRESEQLLLKNTVRNTPRFEATPTPARLATAYKAHKPAQKPARSVSAHAESAWVVW